MPRRKGARGSSPELPRVRPAAIATPTVVVSSPLVGVGSPTTARSAAIDAVIKALNERYNGDGGVRRLSDKGIYPEIQLVISTGLPALDKAIGVGGIPMNKVVIIQGPESSGKTTLAKRLSARAQMQGVLPVTWDVEQSGVLSFDSSLGVDLDEALGSQPDTMEEVFDKTVIVANVCAKLKVPVLFIWDSVASTPLAAELERPVDEEGRMAERAAFLSKHLPGKWMPLLKKGIVGFAIINQLREKIGALPYQKQTYSPGGRALRHYAHVVIEMTPLGKIKQGDAIVGIKTRAQATKNKVAPPYGEAELEIHFNPARLVESGKPIRQPMKPREK